MAESAQDVRRMACSVLQARLNDGRQISEEFDMVLARDENIGHRSDVASAPANAVKNRYVNVLPYDHNRVLLRPCSAGPAANNAAPGPSAANGHSHSGPTATATSSSSNNPRAFPSHAASSRPLPHPDYINASHIVHDDRATYGFCLSYIACQGPVVATVADFWRMCWSEGVGAIVMLTNITERGISKCSPYFPGEPGKHISLRAAVGPPAAGGGGGAVVAAAARLSALQHGPSAAGQQQQGARAGWDDGGAVGACGCQAPSEACVEEVAALSSRQLLGGDLTETRLLLTPQQQQHQQQQGPSAATAAAPGAREIFHLHYNSWPDHGTPADAAAIRTLCDLLEPVRAAGGAVVVHCSAGIGRTGTFCAIDILRHRLAVLAARAEARPGSVRQDAIHAALDLPELVHSLRRQRCGMVQTVEQYDFCYQAVYEELRAALGLAEVGVRRAGGSGGRGGPGTPPRGGRR